MDSIEILLSQLDRFNGYLWGPVMLLILLGTHLYFTIRLKGIQRYLPLALRISLSDDCDAKGDISHFQSLSISLSSTMGIGTLLGVSMAIVIGGPGAIFWMVIAGFLGIATKYAEALLAIKYRIRTRRGHRIGGPMYTIDHGLNQKWLAVALSVLILVAAFFAGNIIFAHHMALSLRNSMDVDPWVISAFITVPIAILLVGGIKQMAKALAVIVPAVAGLFIVMIIGLLFVNGTYVFTALKLIITGAFSVQAAGGGFIGATVFMALRAGIGRGQSPMDAGLGVTSIAAASTRTRDPVRQALVASTSTFWDSLVICSLTGLALVSSIAKNPAHFSGLAGESMVRAAFTQIPGFGPFFYPIILYVLMIVTILGWSFYGERAIEYLINRRAIATFRYFWVIAIFFGATLKPADESQLSHLLAECAYLSLGLIVIPNIISLFMLNKTVVAETRKYLWDNPEAHAEMAPKRAVRRESKREKRTSHSDEFA